MCGRVRHGTFREPREGSSFAKVSCAKRGKLEEEEVGNEGRENEKGEKERKKKRSNGVEGKKEERKDETQPSSSTHGNLHRFSVLGIVFFSGPRESPSPLPFGKN